MHDFKITLNNGIKIPVIGYGVYQIDNLKNVKSVLKMQLI